MKKIIIVLLCALSLCSCSTEKISFTPKSELCCNCVIDVGDFSYNALVRYKGDVVYITPRTTNAAGMTMSCDGEAVTFSQGSLSNTLSVSDASRMNPACIVLFALQALPSASRRMDGDCIVYKGKISAGEFELRQSSNGDYVSLCLCDGTFSLRFLP